MAEKWRYVNSKKELEKEGDWYAFNVQRDGPLLSQVSTLNMTIGVGILRQSGNHLGLSIGPHVVHQRICPWTAIWGVEVTTQATQSPSSRGYRSNWKSPRGFSACAEELIYATSWHEPNYAITRFITHFLPSSSTKSSFPAWPHQHCFFLLSVSDCLYQPLALN